MHEPVIHFDYFQKHVPYGREGYALTQESCRPLSTEELLEGTISGFLAQLDGVSRSIGYQMTLYDRLGQNTFVVGPRVQELFRGTNLSKVTHDMLVPPVRAFYIALAGCPWRIWGGDRTRWHPVTGLYVSFTSGYSRQEGAKANGINFCIWGGPNERSEGNSDDAVLWHSINLDLWRESGEDLETFFEGSYVMLADVNNPVGWEGTDPLSPTAGPALPADADNLAEQREMMRAVMRTALNVCLYTSSESPDLEVVDGSDAVGKLRGQLGRAKSPGKRKKLQRRLDKASRARVTRVGPGFEDMLVSAGGTHASPVAHTVAPHYQRYWVGSGSDKRQVWRYRAMHVRGNG